MNGRGVDVLVLAAGCVYAADMIGVCREVMDREDTCKALGRPYNDAARQVAADVHFDARHALAEHREALVDMGANVREATSAVLGLSELGGSGVS